MQAKLLGAVQPVDHFPHPLPEALVAPAVGRQQNRDEQNGESNFNHRAAPSQARRCSRGPLVAMVALREHIMEQDVARDPQRPPLVATLTLGCKLNQAETQAAARELQAAGCVTVDRPAAADAWLINTCSVTHVADRKARRLIRVAKRLSPNAPVIVTGCYSEHAADTLISEVGADVVVRNADKATAASAVLRALGATNGRDPAAAANSTGRTRAFIKIQEGCNDVCAFCIVPHVRGRERAVPIDTIVSQAAERAAEGVQEIVLTGTQPGAYGRDRDDGANAARLLQSLLADTDVPRLRYSSIQPQDITPQLLACWEDARLCRHFHLALQSGSDAVLAMMRRRYDAAAFLHALDLIRATVSGAAITTDVIVGFPGETDADFEQTLEICRRAEFADMHVFPYSPRPRTSAALLDDDVPPETKRRRSRVLRDLAAAQARRYRERIVGEIHTVLFESSTGSTLHGLTDTYVPVVSEWNQASPPPLNQLVATRIVGLSDDAETPSAIGELELR